MADPRDAEIADLKKQLAEKDRTHALQLAEKDRAHALQLAKERTHALQLAKERRQVIQRMLPGAIAYALAEDARYRRSMLTGRCGVVAEWHTPW